MGTGPRWQGRWPLLEQWMRRTKYSTPDSVCSEERFLRLVASESKRSERSSHPCRIALVYCTNPQGIVIPLGAEPADKAFSLLARSCRDTDYIGWYRQGDIVGVLLTTLQRESIADGCKTLKARLSDRLRDALGNTTKHFLQIHLLAPDDLATFMVSNCASVSPVPLNQVL